MKPGPSLGKAEILDPPLVVFFEAFLLLIMMMILDGQSLIVIQLCVASQFQ